MAAKRIALCVDEASARNPEAIGLGGEQLAMLDWLDVHTSGEEARQAVLEGADIEEAWIVSCDDVEPINLAATLKADRPDLCVRLVGLDGGGSLYSRAYNAAIDEVMDGNAFLRRYGDRKRASLLGAAGDAGGPLAAKGDAAGRAPVQEARSASAPSSPDVDFFQVKPALDPAPNVEPVAPRILAVPRSRGLVLPIVSGSGGAGKSTVAVTGAFIASRLGYRVLLVDYDLQFGDAAILAGRADALCIDTAISRPELLEQELRKNLNPTVLAAPGRLEDAEEVARCAPRLVDETAGAFDIVIANTGAAWAEYHAALLERSSAALFLVDQRPSSLRACRHALELCARCGIATGPFRYAVNRCGKGSLLSSVDVSCALQGAHVYELEDGGRDVEDFLGAGAVDDLIDSGNPFCASLEKLIGQVLPGAGLLAADGAIAPTDKRAAKRRARHNGRRRGWGL